MGWHKAKEGETISSLSHDSGLPIETIWVDSNNSELRSRHRSWDQVGVGDHIFLREIETKSENAATDQRHNFRAKLPLGLVLRFDLDPEDASTHDDRFTLKADDNSFNATKTVIDDMLPGDRFVDLHFSGLKRKKRYSLVVDPGEEGAPYTLFEDVPYDDLVGLYAAHGMDYEPDDVVQQDGQDDDGEADDDPFPEDESDEE